MNNENAIIECVANFSHGSIDRILENLISSINNIKGQKLLHIDNNIAANRTVLTFAGNPDAVIEAAFCAIRSASTSIDMRTQIGAHPRIGATDVCPLVPLANISMKETIAYAHKLAERVGAELNIPVFLYENAAKLSYRTALPQIRKGSYEGLFEKMKLPTWQPDYGPTLNESTKESIAKTGATVIGARSILVAFNISLDTSDEKIATEIARKVRSSGFVSINAASQIKERVAGLLPQVRAIGWYIDDFKTAQVSMNLLDYKVTSPLKAWETVKELARTHGVSAIGCEVIGLIPEACVLEAGIFSLKENSATAENSKLIEAGIAYLGLDKIKAFNPQKKILEYALQNAGLAI